MKRFLSATLLLCLSFSAQAASYLIENVRIFNGVDPELVAGHVLVEDGVITTVSGDEITAPDGATVIATDGLDFAGTVDAVVAAIRAALVDGRATSSAPNRESGR